MTHTTLLDCVTALMDKHAPDQCALADASSGMHFLRFHAPTGQDATVYRPLLCLVLQGAKEVGTSRKSLRVGQGQSLIVSHALPVVSRIIEAAPDRPYVALVFPIDLDLMRGLPPPFRPAPHRPRATRFRSRSALRFPTWKSPCCAICTNAKPARRATC